MHPRADETSVSITSEPSTPQQRRLAHALIVCIAVAFGVTAVYGTQPLPRSDGFLPTAQSIILVFDALTAIILFGQYAVTRSRALLALATGYLTCALFVLAHTLTFPGALSPNGLFGATANTAGWLYVAWHACFPVAAIAYVLLKQESSAGVDSQRTARSAITSSVLLATTVVFTVTLLMIVGDGMLPTFLTSEREFNPVTRLVSTINLILGVVALALIQVRRESLLDEWLRVAVCAAVAEGALIVLVASRYTVAFYSVRILAIAVSGAVLAALLWETTKLYNRHAISLSRLQRERANKLMSFNLMIGSVAHEIKQPLAVISLRSGTLRRLLEQPQPDQTALRECLTEVERAGDRVVETIDSVRALFGGAKEDYESIDVNELVRATVRILEPELTDRGIAFELEIAFGLPPIVGHKVQLQEVLLNIVQNSIDSMADVTNRGRTLRLRTARDTEAVAITIEDSGAGIEPDRLTSIFDSFTTTKMRGAGLGLGICRMIVDQHQGEVSVKSELGGGTQFRIVLPGDGATPRAEDRAGALAQSRTRKSSPYIRGSA